MKIKFLAIYLLAGAAFLGVSLWVFLSSGRSAKAIRAKYKLGGVMLTAWTMFSSAACEGVTPQVTCYEPVDPQIMCYDVPMETDIVTVSVKGKEGIEVQPGETLVIHIETPSFKEYECRIHGGELVETPVIQKASFTVPEQEGLPEAAEFELVLAQTDYKGSAIVQMVGFYDSNEGERHESSASYFPTITIR